MKYIARNLHVLLTVFVMFVTLQWPNMAAAPASVAGAARYSEEDRSWTLASRVVQIRDVSIYGRAGTIAGIEYMHNGIPKQTWAAVRIDSYSFGDGSKPITVGDRVILQVSGPYVSSNGVDWTGCPPVDLYCQYAGFIEGGFPTSEDFNGLTISPSNMLIHWGSVGTGDWVNGILAWRIRRVSLPGVRVPLLIRASLFRAQPGAERLLSAASK